MNLRQQYAVERIIRDVVTNNKDKSLNELKRMIKAQIRLKFDESLASQIGTDEIIEVITSEGMLRKGYLGDPIAKKKPIKLYREEKEI